MVLRGDLAGVAWADVGWDRRIYLLGFKRLAVGGSSHARSPVRGGYRVVKTLHAWDRPGVFRVFHSLKAVSILLYFRGKS
jgi:hypothetical protein